MKENKYDDVIFFSKYSQMPRSKEGLNAAGEWQDLKKMLPQFKGKHVLDLGCGFGWHCDYAAQQGAISVVGVDISKKMLERAKTTKHNNITFIHSSIEDYKYPENAFDLVISSLAFHYVQSLSEIFKKIFRSLKQGGSFIFSIEHPIFTAQGRQEWICDKNEKPLYWPVDNYFFEGSRDTVFLGENVKKYHRTLTTYLRELTKQGFIIADLCEPTPPANFIEDNPKMKNEFRRPMMLIISALKV